MASEPSEETLERSTRELLSVLREIEAAVGPPEPRRLIKPPTPRGLIEFTSEVGIPAAILILRTNIAALELLQRTLRMMGDHETHGESGTPTRDRVADLTAVSLSRLDQALGDLQTALEGRSTDRTPDDLLAEARKRTEELEAQLESMGRATPSDPPGVRTETPVDVEAELDSLRQSVGNGGDGDDGHDGEDQADTGSTDG